MKKREHYYHCQNPSCQNQVKVCPKCHDGILLKRKGKYGEFFGCSEFSKSGCKYTEKVRDLESQSATDNS